MFREKAVDREGLEEEVCKYFWQKGRDAWVLEQPRLPLLVLSCGVL